MGEEFIKKVRESINSGSSDPNMFQHPCQDAFDVLSTVSDVMRECGVHARVIDDAGRIKLVISTLKRYVELISINTHTASPWSVTFASAGSVTECLIKNRSDLEALCIEFAGSLLSIARGEARSNSSSQ